MQKARRLACSTASMSSPSNTSLSLRRRSRTSSAGGDYMEASRSNIPKNPFESKFRLRKRNNNKGRLEKKGSKKKTKKTGKSSKSVKSTFGSLQNTVVLAPFHTLKKCFQTKLVDQYLNEKIKKNNHKAKMAEKQNMLFEYDVMEMKPLEQKNARNEKKGSKGKKGRVRFKETRSNRKRSKSQSYCQCEKTNPNKSKEQKTNSPKNSSPRNQPSKPEKRSFQASLPSNNYQRVFSISGPDESKRRRLDGPQITNLSRGPQFDIMPDLLELNRPSCSEPTSETNMSFSNVSSGPKIDSWETISDSPSYIVLEGSLAISTTSFDSSLEQYERDRCSYSEQSENRIQSSGGNSGYNTRLKTLREKSGRGKSAADFNVNVGDDESGQYIMNDKMSNSDGQLIDLMDSELQGQVISSGETPQHLQLLGRKIKTQSRKLDRENDSSKAYFLRSQSGSKERVKTAESEERTFLGKYRNGNELERSEPPATVSGAQEEGGNIGREENNVEPVGGSCEENLTVENLLIKTNTSCQNPADLSQPPPEVSSSNIENTTDISKVSETADAVNRCSSQKETNLNLNVGSEPPCEVLYKWGSDAETDRQRDSTARKSQEKDKADFGSEERTPEGQRLHGDFIDQSFVELFPAREAVDRFQESPDADRHVAHQPQDKEPSFIFGPRTTSERLGESCEFSLGLNWVFSDDDNSEPGDHFL